MILLAALLSFGWPALRIEWVPPSTPVPAGMFAVRLAHCCGSMRPSINGGELAYAEPYTGQPLLGHVVSNGKWLHQVTAETATAVRTAGTANRHSDPWTQKTEIQYIIRYIIRP